MLVETVTISRTRKLYLSTDTERERSDDIRVSNVDSSSSFPCQPHCDKHTLRRFFPILQWLPQYTITWLIRDFIAGMTVGLTAIPQGIAYAVVAGLPPKYGLYSGFVGCFVYAILGSTKDITIGPTAIMALLSHEYVANAGPEYAILLCFTTGCIILLFGFLRLGFLVEFISMPVTCGFTSAAAVTILVSQLKNLFGLKGHPDGFVECISHFVTNIQNLRVGDTVLGLVTIVTLIAIKCFKERTARFDWPAALKRSIWLLNVGRNAVVVIAGSLLAFIFYQNSFYPFQLTGDVASGFPPFNLPPFSTVEGNRTVYLPEMVTRLGSGIIVIPLVAILESISIAKAFAKGKTVDASQEMVALGVSNILGSLFSSMPTTGSFTRTAVNNASGVKTAFGGVFTGLMILLSCGFLTDAFFFIPKASLSGLIICAMIYMVEYEAVQLLWRTKKMDLLPFLVTFTACLLLGLEIGMIVGISTNLLLILYNSARPSVSLQWVMVGGEDVLLVTPRESLVFPATEYLRQVIVQTCAMRDVNAIVVVDGYHVNRIDSTMAKGMKVLTEDLAARKQPVYFWRWGEEAMLTALGFDSALGTFFRFDDTLIQLIKGPNYVSPESMTNLKHNGNPGSGTSTPTHLRSKHSSLSEEPGYDLNDKKRCLSP
ncbi:sodium-independent sulfate anion transporter-like isoform X2 [Macrosteles quadrilineatus]|uniref:sodium-independent sulfate anion transporter-like isoform X2 n=1 Tax=Macrosteles quadrilineatus TaxID=74068 RepID=UPI0023E2281E|nr:sodium-independent sulfate anion transporter-like isoform X2 [Macrosteles quadrilineatus]